MTPDERKQTLRRVIDEVYNKGNVDAMDEVFAPHCSFHDPSFPVEGVAGTKQFVRELRAAQPDFHCDVQDILVDGDRTAARWTMGGTDRNEFRGMPPTGKSYVVTGTTFNQWEGDRIVEEWDNYDSLGMLQQLGHVPETAELMQSH
jgi:steroid delta-isomerase-like uncharacterized protein